MISSIITFIFGSWSGILVTIFITSVLVLLILLLNLVFNVSVPNLSGKHVVITGGSSGIGQSVAFEAVKRGAHVTVIARDKAKLDATLKELDLIKTNDLQKFTSYSLDVTQTYEDTETAIKYLEDTISPIDIFVNCAGTCVCGTIELDTEENFRKMLELNLIGTILPTKAVVRNMIRRGHGGIIVITASQAALLGIYGMGAYCASKWGLRGFAETLHQEVTRHNISVTLCLPPDTDTPGLEIENRGKPEETKQICSGTGLVMPDIVARKLLSDALKGRFFSTTGLDGTLLTIGCAGFSPLSSVAEVILQIMLTSCVRIISIFHLSNAKNIIERLAQARQCSTESEKNK